MKITYEPQDVAARLEDLGLEEGVLIEALQQANLYRVRLTTHHPRLYRYSVLTNETVAALRDLLVPKGWEKRDEGHYELVINPERTIAIAVASGDLGTGDRMRDSSNRSPKGPHTARAVETNRQGDLFSELLPVEPIAGELVETWILLHRVQGNEIRIELSRPNNFDEAGKITSWSERIVLGVIPLDEEGTPLPLPNLPDIDIAISRKSA
jgi:hypothetical protein